MRRATLALTIFLPLGLANAGIDVRYESTGPAMPATASNGSVLIEGSRSRMDAGGDATVLFDGTAQRMEILSHKDRTYMVLDQASAEAIAAEIEPALRQMRAQLEALPPEQRAMMEKMLGERMGIKLGAEPEPAPDLDLEKTGKTDAVGGIDCAWWNATNATVLVYEYCIAEPSDLPSGEQLLGFFRDLMQFQRDIVGTINRHGTFQVPRLPIADVRDVKGLPLISRQYRDGNMILETRYVSIVEKEVAADTFTRPNDYREQKLMATGR